MGRSLVFMKPSMVLHIQRKWSEEEHPLHRQVASVHYHKLIVVRGHTFSPRSLHVSSLTIGCYQSLIGDLEENTLQSDYSHSWSCSTVFISNSQHLTHRNPGMMSPWTETLCLRTLHKTMIQKTPSNFTRRQHVCVKKGQGHRSQDSPCWAAH